MHSLVLKNMGDCYTIYIDRSPLADNVIIREFKNKLPAIAYFGYLYLRYCFGKKINVGHDEV